MIWCLKSSVFQEFSLIRINVCNECMENKLNEFHNVWNQLLVKRSKYAHDTIYASFLEFR